MDEFPSKTVYVTPQNSPIDDWMSFPIKGLGTTRFLKKLKHDFWMDEFSSKTVSEISQKFANKG